MKVDVDIDGNIEITAENDIEEMGLMQVLNDSNVFHMYFMSNKRADGKRYLLSSGVCYMKEQKDEVGC